MQYVTPINESMLYFDLFKLFFPFVAFISPFAPPLLFLFHSAQ